MIVVVPMYTGRARSARSHGSFANKLRRLSFSKFLESRNKVIDQISSHMSKIASFQVFASLGVISFPSSVLSIKVVSCKKRKEEGGEGKELGVLLEEVALGSHGFVLNSVQRV